MHSGQRTSRTRGDEWVARVRPQVGFAHVLSNRPQKAVQVVLASGTPLVKSVNIVFGAMLLELRSLDVSVKNAHLMQPKERQASPKLRSG